MHRSSHVSVHCSSVHVSPQISAHASMLASQQDEVPLDWVGGDDVLEDDLDGPKELYVPDASPVVSEHKLPAGAPHDDG